MFEPNSRYFDIEKVTIVSNEPVSDTNNRTIIYKKRRFIPSAEEIPLLQEVIVTGGDRLDLISSRTLGDPEQFWRICDMNEATHPLDLTSEIGRILKIPTPFTVSVR